MPLERKCLKCGFDIADPSAQVCPACGAQISAAPGRNLWIVAAFQFTLATGFMLLFRFPKWMIGAFAVMILVGTLVASATKSKVASRSVAPQRPITRPILLRFVGAGLALFSFAALAFLLLGSVMFLNSWNDWHRYEGQPYHVTTFQVRQTYWQRQSKGGPDIYASGIVEGHREWISLQPYVHDRMRNPQELDARVPAGTAIPIYFFPDMKGRLRVRVYQGVPLADAYHQTALNAAKYGSIGLAICIGVIFLLLRIQKTCFAEEDNFQQLGASAGR